MKKENKELVLFLLIDKRLGTVQIYYDEGSMWTNKEKHHDALKVKFKSIEVINLSS